MSMRQDVGGESVSREDEAWLEQEIQRQLDNLDPNDAQDPDWTDTDDSSQDYPEDSEQTDIIPSMQDYISLIQKQSRSLETELEECDTLMQEADIVSSRQPGDHTETILKELAQQEGIDVIELKQKVLDDISCQDQKDEDRLKQRDQSTDKNIVPDVNSNIELREVDVSDTTEKQDGANAVKNSILLLEGQGVIAEVTDSDRLEKELWEHIQSMEEKYQQRNEIRQQERAQILEAISQKEEMMDERRRQKEEAIHLEEQQLQKINQEREAKLMQETEELRKTMESSMKLYEEEQAKMLAEADQERQQLLAEKQKNKEQIMQRQTESVKLIQKYYRGYRVRKLYGAELKSRLEKLKEQKLNERVKQIEEKRNAEIEAKKHQEEKELARERQEAEMERIKNEQERKQMEEKIKIEEEKKKAEQEQKHLEEENAKKRGAVERKKIEDERLKKELEEKQKEEKQKMEEVNKTLAEEKRLKEEADRKRKQEDQKRKEELERKRRELEKQEKEAERLRKEEVEKKKSEEAEALERAIKEQVRQRELEESLKSNNISDDLKAEPVVEVNQDNNLRTSVTQIPTPPKSTEGKPSSARRNRTTIAPLRRSRAFLSGLQTPQAWGENLPELMESKRLNWIQHCTAWSKVLGELRTRRLPQVKKVSRRPLSAKHLPSLDKNLILSAAKVNTLQQITTVELQDLPGCSLRTFSQCPQLRSLAIHNCHLVSTEGLENCKLLEYVDLKNNKLENISLREMSHLIYVDVSHNLLTTIQGLEQCTKLRTINISYNRITRIGGLDHLLSLHTLNLSHNQLITSRGLSAAATIQYLDLSHNHLTNIDDLHNLGLLQVLNISGNTLSQLPSLHNHVLLYEISASENNLSNLTKLSEAWVPMLTVLNLQHNSLTSIPDLVNLINVEELNIADNQLLDLENTLPGLVSLRRLQRLLLNGNPVSEESDWRSIVEDKLPRLQMLDHTTLTSTQPPLPMSKFERMCLAQRNLHFDMRKGFENAYSKAGTIWSKSYVYGQFYTQSYNLASEHRYCHEYGEISPEITSQNFKFEALIEERRPPINSSLTNGTKSSFENAVANVNKISQNKNSTQLNNNLCKLTDIVKTSEGDEDIKLDLMLTEDSSQGNSKISPSPNRIDSMAKESQAETVDMKSKFDALLIKSTSSSPIVHQPVPPRFTREQTNVAASAVGKILQQEGLLRASTREEDAATKIQALWRGYILRKRLQYALSYAQQQSDDDSDVEFGEVDLKDFDFNEDDLNWIPTEIPQMPNSHPVLKPHTDNMMYDKPPRPPPNPAQVWHNTTPNHVEYIKHDTMTSKPPLPPLSRMSDNTSTDIFSDMAHTYRSKASRKEEKLAEEWGFKDSRTAELMIQRAKKLKYNALKKKRLGQLDPKQRLALHRKLQEANKVRTVLPPKRSSEKREYFQAREEDEIKEEREKHIEQQTKVVRTYEWLHTQVGEYDVSSSRIQNRDLTRTVQPTQLGAAQKVLPVHLFHSEGNLPKMDPDILAGKRALLTGSPHSMDLQSMDSASIVADINKPRRMSVPRSESDERLPPIKTSSAPSSRPDKMSWRNPDVNKSVGWGGGKKHAPIKH